MSEIQRALIGAFQHHKVNEQWIAMMLYFTRIYNISRRNFERIFYSGRSGSERHRDEAKNDNQAQELGHLAWKPVRFPALPDVFFYYQTFGTAYMIYVLVRNTILLDHLSWFVKIEKPAHCYLPGYFFLHPWLARQTATLLALLHLLWRLIQFLGQRPYFLHMIFFLTLNVQNLDLFWRQFQSRTARDGILEYQSITAAAVAAGELKKEPGEASKEHLVERLLKRVICYRVKLGDRTLYRLRPNRTPEARQSLQRIVAMAALYVGSFFFFLASSITLFIVAVSANNRAFVSRYPGCDKHLDQLSRSNQLGDWSLSLTWPVLYSLLFDVVENIVLWGDSGIAVMFVLTTIYLLNIDNQLHQDHLDRKLRRVESEVRSAHLANQDKWMSNLALNRFHGFKCLEMLQPNSQTAEWLKTHQEDTNRFGRTTAAGAEFIRPPAICKSKRESELDSAVLDLQMHFDDFFRELKQTDVLVSEVMTSTICIWLSLFSVTGRYALDAYAYHRDPAALLLVLSLEGFAFIIISSVSSGLLNLHRNCLNSYVRLCSLMAYDRSEHKIKFLKLMEFYTVKKCSAYTLFHEYPYTKTTYLSIFGWSLSCLFIIDGLLRH